VDFERAWAAGFFDAEGCTSLSIHRAQSQLRLKAVITQSGRDRCPEVLFRFREIVGIGALRGPSRLGVYSWQTETAADTMGALAVIWPWLGPAKTRQALRRTSRFGAHRRLHSANPRSPRTLRSIAAFLASREALLGRQLGSNSQHEVAWAAGFFDGEGTICLKRRVWKDSLNYSLSAGVPQGGRAQVPEVLTRFQRAVKMGAIYGPGNWRNARLRSYDWHLTQPEDVRRLFELLRPFLGERKIAQAEAAFAIYDSRSHRSLRRPRVPSSSARWLESPEALPR
jgi:hypothetical protein